MKSFRLNLLVSADEKAAIAEKAARANISTSELIRRAVYFYDPDADWDELKMLVSEVGGYLKQIVIMEERVSRPQEDMRGCANPFSTMKCGSSG